MSGFLHDDPCRTATQNAQVLREQWKAKWPDYCQTCEGQGLESYGFNPAPAGLVMSGGEMIDVYPCPDCLDHGTCPRCGRVGFSRDHPSEEGLPCDHCKWNYDDALPQLPECWCGDERIDNSPSVVPIWDKKTGFAKA